MKLSKGMIALIAGVAFSGGASAPDQAAVSAEKQAPIKTLIPGAYDKVEVRHDVLRQMNKDTVDDDVRQVNVRPTLGLTMFNDAVDTSFTYVFKHSADNVIKKSDAY